MAKSTLAIDILFASASKEDSNAISVRILKERWPNVGTDFTIHPTFHFNETPEQRAKRELGFPIEGIEP